MSYQVIEIECPSCGGKASLGQKECEWCNNPLIISTFNSVYSMPIPSVGQLAEGYCKGLDANHPKKQELNNAVAMCYLKLKLYGKALPAFEKAMEDNFDNSETFFYAAICLLEGKKAFLHQRPTIDKILEYINAALMIEPKGIYYYFLAYIKYDYFYRKNLNSSPNYRELLSIANNEGFSEFDVEQLYSILNVSRPTSL